MSLVDALIERAKKTPYSHLDGYMERYWLVPYSHTGHKGCAPVSFRARPIAWVLQHLGIAVRIHHILRSDKGRDCHDHPWNYLTVILRGAYFEVLPGQENWQGALYVAGSVLPRSAKSWHRLVVPEHTDCWTLFITGPKRQSWGFLVPGIGKVPWRDYLNHSVVHATFGSSRKEARHG